MGLTLALIVEEQEKQELWLLGNYAAVFFLTLANNEGGVHLVDESNLSESLLCWILNNSWIIQFIYNLYPKAIHIFNSLEIGVPFEKVNCQRCGGVVCILSPISVWYITGSSFSGPIR